MSPIGTLFFLACAIALYVLPRKLAPIPLLVGCCYMSLGQGLELGPISLPIFRMLILVGFARAITKNEFSSISINGIDRKMFFLMFWIFFASFFHDGVLGSGPVYVVGVILNFSGIYFLMRAWCRNLSEVTEVIVLTAFILVPVALEMIFEKATGKNLFSVFGGVSSEVVIREGKLRANGPFSHPILAGTVGATCIPLFLGIWKSNRLASIVGILAGLSMTVASGSSGPIMSAGVGIFAVMMWPLRAYTNLMRLAAVVAYFGYQILTGEPGYFIMNRIDISGGSTGYHRAHLIQSAFGRLEEWWLFGTDLTRHWMATGVSFTPYHTDITNYYLTFGVMAGLPALLVVVAMLIQSFKWTGVIYKGLIDQKPDLAFKTWCLGSAMLAHAATSVSVAYFDQSLVFFWMNIAIVSSMYSGETVEDESELEDEEVEDDSAGTAFNRWHERLGDHRRSIH